MNWEVWAIASGNLIATTESEAEALGVVRDLLATDWRPDELSLIFDDQSRPVEDLPPALSGDPLVRRAGASRAMRRATA